MGRTLSAPMFDFLSALLVWCQACPREGLCWRGKLGGERVVLSFAHSRSSKEKPVQAPGDPAGALLSPSPLSLGGL